MTVGRVYWMVSRSAGSSVEQLVGRSVIISKRGGKFTSMLLSEHLFLLDPLIKIRVKTCNLVTTNLLTKKNNCEKFYLKRTSS